PRDQLEAVFGGIAFNGFALRGNRRFDLVIRRAAQVSRCESRAAVGRMAGSHDVPFRNKGCSWLEPLPVLTTPPRLASFWQVAARQSIHWQRFQSGGFSGPSSRSSRSLAAGIVGYREKIS